MAAAARAVPSSTPASAADASHRHSSMPLDASSGSTSATPATAAAASSSGRLDVKSVWDAWAAARAALTAEHATVETVVYKARAHAHMLVLLIYPFAGAELERAPSDAVFPGGSGLPPRGGASAAAAAVDVRRGGRCTSRHCNSITMAVDAGP
jgi:hypothetical protein